MSDDSLGGLAKRWLRTKAKHLTTADNRTRDRAEGDLWQTEKEIKDAAIGEAVMTAVPGLRRMRDGQEAAARRREAERDARWAAEIAARPRRQVELWTTGAVVGHWAGLLHVDVHVRPPEDVDDVDDEGGDPLGAQPTLAVTVDPGAGDDATLTDDRFRSWRFQVAGWAGAGRYDLVASRARQREAGWEPDPLETELELGAGGDESFFLDDAAGPCVVAVSADGRTIDVQLALAGARGELSLRARIGSIDGSPLIA